MLKSVKLVQIDVSTGMHCTSIDWGGGGMEGGMLQPYKKTYNLFTCTGDIFYYYIG